MHKCPKCGSKAYVGLHSSIECSDEACEHYSATFAATCKDTDPNLPVPDFKTGELLDSDEGQVIYLGPTGPAGATFPSDLSTESEDELEIDWEDWEDSGAYFED